MVRKKNYDHYVQKSNSMKEFKCINIRFKFFVRVLKTIFLNLKSKHFFLVNK